MTAPELVPKKEGQGDAEQENVRRPDRERRDHPATRRTVKRWEFGVFVRKIVNGWLAYYKQFPPGSEARPQTAVHQTASAETTEGGGRDSLVSGPVQVRSGHGQGSNDTGPIGETSFEAGAFLRSTSDTSTSSSDEESDGS